MIDPQRDQISKDPLYPYSLMQPLKLTKVEKSALISFWNP